MEKTRLRDEVICPRSYSKCDQAELQTEVQFQGSLLLVTMHFLTTVPRVKWSLY